MDRLLDRPAARPGNGRDLAGDLDRPRLGLHVDDLVAGDPLLELLERAVGDHGRRDAVEGHDLRQVGSREDLRLDELAGADELAVERSVVVEVGLDLLGLPLLHRRGLTPGWKLTINRYLVISKLPHACSVDRSAASPRKRSRPRRLDIGCPASSNG